MSEETQLPKFKPERPIYLNEQNTGFKTKAEVLVAIQKLRDAHWLCAYNESSRPFHMSFNNEKEFQQFKKCCKDLSITLKSPVYQPEEIEELELKENETVKAEPTSTFEDPMGKIHINS